MALEDHRSRLFIAGGSRSHQDHIVQGILMDFQPPLPAKIRQPVADGFGVPGSMGDFRQFFKEMEHPAGFQRIQYSHDATTPLLVGWFPYIPRVYRMPSMGATETITAPVMSSNRAPFRMNFR